MSLKNFVLAIALCVLVAVIICGCSFGTSGSAGGTSSSGTNSSAQSSGSSGTQTGQSSSLEGDPTSSEKEGDEDSTSAQTSEQPPCEPPVEFNVTVEGKTICWDNVAAAVYEVKIGDSVFTTVSCEFTADNLAVGVYGVVVTAYVTLNPAITAEASAELIIRAEAPVVIANGNTLEWGEVEGAIAYAIYKETAFIAEISGNSYEADEGKYTIVAVFEDKRLNTDHSNVAIVGEVKEPAPVLTREGDYITWTAVEGAICYEIYVNGVLYQMAFGTGYKFINHYESEFKEDFPNGVTIFVVALFGEDIRGARSNEIFFS